MRSEPADFLELSREILGRGATLRFRARGNSMHPFIEDGDILVVKPINGALATIGDVIFYRHSEGSLTAHRLVKIDGREGGPVLVTKGDSLDYLDPPVQPEQILGRVVSIERGGRHIRLDGGIGTAVGRTWARVSPGTRWFRPFVRPVWRLFRYGLPLAAGLIVRTVQGLPLYRKMAGAWRGGVSIREFSEADEATVSAWPQPDRAEPPVSPDVTSTRFVAEKNGRIIGSVELVRRPAEFGFYEGHWLSSLDVKLAYRGRGIGEALSRQVIARSREEGSRELCLMVRENNHTAVKLYGKLGFQRKIIPEIEADFEQLRRHGRSMLLMSFPLSGEGG